MYFNFSFWCEARGSEEMYSKGLCSSVRPRGTVESFYLCEHNLGRKGLKTKANLQGYSFTVATTHSAVSPHRTFQLLKHRLQTSRAVLPRYHRSSLTSHLSSYGHT